MNWKTWIPLVVAIVLGLVAMKVARDVMAKNQSPSGAGAGTAIVVARNDLSAGTALTAADLGTMKVAGDVKSDVMFTNPAELEGRVLTVAAAKGSPIVQTMLAPTGTGSGLQALIPEGMRAITMEINEFSGVGGYLTEGARVDVVASINGDNGEMLSRIIVQNVKVQALGSRQAEQGAPIKSVTLLTTPKEAEAIELAATTGRPRLVLRSSGDNDTATSNGVTVAELRRGGLKPSADPFMTQVDTSSQSPTTKPASIQQVIHMEPQDSNWTRQREVKIIRAGVESTATVEESGLPAGPRWMTGAETDEIPGADNK